MLQIPLLHAFGEHHSVSPILLSSQRYEIIPSIYRLIDVNKPVQILIRGAYVFCFFFVSYRCFTGGDFRFTVRVGWSGGAKVLGKLLVPGRPTNLNYSRARAFCACRRCGWGLFGHFFSHLSFLYSFSLSLGDGPI